MFVAGFGKEGTEVKEKHRLQSPCARWSPR